MTQEKDGQNKKKSKKPSANREFSVIAYLFFGLFLCMMGYLAYFQIAKSESFINSPYNSLQNLFSGYVVRGEIRSADGQVLARTVVSEDGSETREYPFGRMFAHAVGYADSGKSGLENQCNFSLLRSHAFFLERFANEMADQKNIGDNVITTLDFGLQKTAYDALGNYDGAVIAMEPETGKILAMVSKPDFDPNTVAADWEEINGEGSSVLFNRATQGQYAPGSVFKIFTTLEYYRENPDSYQDYLFQCEGEFTKDSKTIHCAENEVHGTEDLRASFANSCNSSYANLALSLDRDQFSDLCDSLLFNRNLPIAFESGVSSMSLTDQDSDSLVMETGIGQGKTMVSPLHMMLIAAAVANDGVLMAPYLVDRVENYDGVTVTAYDPREYRQLLTGEEAAFLQDYMYAVVNDGTGSVLSGQPYAAYGKTGTAQVSDETEKLNAWFAGYAEMEGKNSIAVAVIVEDSGYGNAYAVPIAKKVFDAYYGR